MARESKQVQAHPDHVDEVIKYYERWGWEVISNQRHQEKERRGDTVYTNTFNKITFSRDKAAPWYGRVCQLENAYYYISEKGSDDYLLAKEYGYTGERPEWVPEPKIYKPGKFFVPFILFSIFVIIAVISFMKFGGNAVGVVAAVFGVISFIVMLCNIGKLSGLKGEAATKALNDYEEKSTKWWKNKKAVEKFLKDKLIEIIEEAERLING